MNKMRRAILVFLGLALLSANPCLAQKNEVLQVVGKAVFKETPENFVLQIDIKETDSLYGRCSEKLLNKLEMMQEALLSKGLEKSQVKTLDLSMAEQYEYVNGKRVKTGYTGTVRLHLEEQYSPKRLGAVIQVPEKHNAAYRLSFALTEAQKEDLTEKAIKAAVEDAKTKAGLIADASGVELVRITKISYEPADPGLYPLNKEVMLATDNRNSGNQLDLSPKSISVQKSVAMEWQISKKAN
jgi:uncharacterized protein YggE